MASVNGVSNNPNGRPKGSKNKNVEPIRQAFKDFVEDNISTIQDSYSQLEPRDQLQFLLAISEFCIPKLARTEITGKDGEAFAINVLQIGEDGEQTKLLKAV